ncbi:hypothetical protein B5F77_08935 [Parabacteroides sp. An277]|uniref:FtsX-like permease family protein n=1 Tax=Parabacteroides sp. An277 TaxID=1965619 RepID=UPI000B3765F8|nr:FtsX-like permease family protein [Parabacteroides sp. An277]OUO52226.1 hypothetical protein B5F77_08935 [Parabacteroides sp. An277]
MNFPFYIARRYLFSKKSHNAINIISLISVCGVMIATLALVCALSVYNGFNDLVSSLFSHFDPELKIIPKEGKVFDPEEKIIHQVRMLPEVDIACEVLQDNALIKYKERQDVGIIKGVDESFARLVPLDSVIIDGAFQLSDQVANYATLGIGLAAHLGINAGFVSPLEIYVPKRDERVNMSNPAASFNREFAFITAVFRINQPVYDDHYMIIPLSVARKLLHYDKEISALELKLKPNASIAKVEAQIKAIVSDKYIVQNRFEQQESSFRMMQIEKWVTFLILCFILAIALFNIVGSLSMLMIEKKEDVRTLRNLGANNRQIRQIFLFEGWMISGFGALVGIVLGILLCMLQQHFGLLRLGDTAGAFIIEAYPVHVLPSDILMVLVTVLSIGFLAAWYPVRYLGNRWLKS